MGVLTYMSFLGLSNSPALTRLFNKCCPEIKNIKNPKIRYNTFILELVNLFQCYKCKEVLSLEFKIDKHKSNKCKTCGNIESKNRRTIGRQYIYDYLKSKYCIDCGEDDPTVLEFDHINPKEKEYNISNMAGKAKREIRSEIDKCIIVCSNCHKRRTAKNNNWYSNIIK